MKYTTPMIYNFINKVFHALVIAALLGLLASCESVKPYQRAYLNDSNMAPGNEAYEAFESSVCLTGKAV
ncbi:MAG: DUF4266 domain-containing protein [Owenweeksia sp.]|nr:DUF4266 domain-containing protein [Owenweeksia sp.]